MINALIINFPFPPLYLPPPIIRYCLLLWEERHDEEGETFVFISKEKKVLSSLLSRKNLLGTENVVILKFDSQKYILTIGIGSITYVEFWLDQQKDYVIAIPFSAVLKNGQNFEEKCSG